MKIGIVLCNQCNTKLSCYISKKEENGAYITSVDSCKHHEWDKRGKISIHKKK